MASELTLGNLKSQALDYAEMTTGFIVDARLDDYANYALGRLHDLLLCADPFYFKKEQDFSVVSGTQNYALPDDFYKDLALYYISGDDNIPMERFNPRMSAGYRAPSSTGTVRMWYSPQCRRLTADDQVIHPVIPVSYEKFVALDMARQCLTKAKLDTSQVAAQLKEEERRITEMAEPRGWGDSLAVEDIDARFGPPMPLSTRGLRYAIVGLHLVLMQEWPPSR